ncbi:protein ABHD15 isoform X2 [Cololabis saira]|nr:protein ABHD15 isoform X2 [Cololabis saira]
MKLAVRAASWRLWTVICLILELPLHRNTRIWSQEVKSTENDVFSGSNQMSNGRRFICKPTALAKYLLQHCGSLASSKLAGWPRGDPHLQTLTSLLLWAQHTDTMQFTRDHLLLRDGGVVALDWAVGTRLGEEVSRKRWEVKKEHQSWRKVLGCFTSTPPVLLLVPQSWGGMSPHLKLLCQQAMRQGFYVVVFHHRGTEGAPLATTRLTEFGDPADLEQAVSYVHSRHPSSVLLAVSEGSGSGALLSYLGEFGSSTHLTAAAAISPVLLGQLWLEQAMPPIYRWGALFHRKMQLSRYADSLRGVMDVDRALGCSSLRDFEEALFCSSAQHQQGSSPSQESAQKLGSRTPGGLAPPVAWALGERAFPARNWESYWGRNEPLRDGDEVAVPVLCICSSDDPLLPPASTLPLSLFQSNPYFLLMLTDRGGHCGFRLEGPEQSDDGRTLNGEEYGGVWSHTAVLEYFRVVADFLKDGVRSGLSWKGPTDNSEALQRSRTNAMTPPLPRRRRRGNMMRRLRAPEQSPVDEAEGGNFTWKRSYTR